MLTLTLILTFMLAAAAAPLATAGTHPRQRPCPGVRAGFTHCYATREARRFRFPAGWLRQAFCIHRHESVDWHRRWVDWRGLPSVYAGGMQFMQSTWERAGGRGEPWQWPVREQVYRAYVIWKANGGSWGEWGTRGKCGLA